MVGESPHTHRNTQASSQWEEDGVACSEVETYTQKHTQTHSHSRTSILTPKYTRIYPWTHNKANPTDQPIPHERNIQTLSSVCSKKTNTITVSDAWEENPEM